MQTERPFEARASSYRTAGLAILGFLFVLIGIRGTHVIVPDPRETSLYESLSALWPSLLRSLNDPATWTSWFVLIFFGACTWSFLAQWALVRPIVRINDHGVYWSRWSTETIPWNQITNPRIVQASRTRFLCFDLIDRGAIRHKRLLAPLAFINRRLGYGDIWLTTINLDRSFEELLTAFGTFSPVAIS